MNPEDALVAALSSCHMLTFLAVAAKRKFVVDRHSDQAMGFLEKNQQGKLAVTRVILHPKVVFGGPTQPAPSSSRSSMRRRTTAASSRTRWPPR
ncbi:OsmC family protein [Nitrospira sp. Kam-Ns4a]